MPVFLPVAGLSLDVLALVAAGGGVGFLSGLLGVGGGFLLTPLLMMLGIPPTVAAASGTNALVATASSGVAAHFRYGNVDLKMGSVLLLGGLSGASAGVELIKVLRLLGNADVFIKLSYILVLGAVGGYMVFESLRNLSGWRPELEGELPSARKPLLKRLPWQMDFPRSQVRHSVLAPFLLCALVGVLAAVMGVGGGFLMVPMMVYLLRMPAHVAVGTDLFQIVFTASGVTLMQAVANQTVDVVLALLLAGAAAAGAQFGAMASRHLRSEHLLLLLGALGLGMALKMAFGVVAAPPVLLESGHGERQVATAKPERQRAPDGRVKLTPQRIEIGARYGGATVRVEGVASPGSSLIVVARGPDAEESFQRKGRVGPIWVTTGRVRVAGAPSLFLLHAPEPVERLLSREEIERFQLDPGAIQRGLRLSPASRDSGRLREDFVRMKAARGAYRVTAGDVRMEPPGPAGAPYRAEIPWPRTAPPESYEVRVYECAGGRVLSVSTAPLEVVKTGFPALVAELSARYALIYGAGAVLSAMLAGFGIDFLVSLLRRKLSRRPRLERARVKGLH